MNGPSDDPQRHARRPQAAGNAFPPLLILCFVLTVWFGFQALQLTKERAAIREAIASQQTAVESSKKLRDSLDAIAKGTQELAYNGNASARLLVEQLKKRGVTINANATMAPPAPIAASGAAAESTP